MEQCGYDHVKKLACKIKSEIDKGSSIKTGVLVHIHVVTIYHIVQVNY